MHPRLPLTRSLQVAPAFENERGQAVGCTIVAVEGGNGGFQPLPLAVAPERIPPETFHEASHSAAQALVPETVPIGCEPLAVGVHGTDEA